MTARVSFSWATLALTAAVSGCGKAEYSGATRYPLSGRVTCDGEPVDLGSISFLPLQEGGQRVSGGYIFDGAYEVPEAQGANAGKHRIEIRWQKRTGKKVASRGVELEDQRTEGLPAKYHRDSELTADVSPGKIRFDFDLKTK